MMVVVMVGSVVSVPPRGEDFLMVVVLFCWDRAEAHFDFCLRQSRRDGLWMMTLGFGVEIGRIVMAEKGQW